MFFGSSPNKLSKNKRALSKYSVGSQEPGLAFDFVDNVYQKDQNKTVNFSGAITHSRSGNAVMTDGYGPELVVNGGFDSDSDWTKGTGWSIYDGKATHASGTASNLEQSFTPVAGKTYAISFHVSGRTAGTVRPEFRGGSTVVGTSTGDNGQQTQFITAVSGNNNFLMGAGSAFDGTIDNVSVREMPVLKWAPHNLIPNSEDFTAVTYSKNDVTVTANYGTAPDGTNTATRLQETGANAYLVRGTLTDGHKKGIWARATSGTGTVNIGSYYTVTDALVTLTEEWQLIQRDVDHSESAGTTGENLYCVDFRAGTLTDIMVWGAHSFRQDLGGMAGNPDQPPSRASYVPTTSSAVYLPRVGHHVYNGSAWVNEGLLAESEARTNTLEYSDFSAAFSSARMTKTADQAVSPDGNENAAELVESTDTGSHFISVNNTVTVSVAHTLSCYVKQASGSRSVILRTNNQGADSYIVFDFSTGSITETGSSARNGTVQDVGNGWYRIAFSYTNSANSLSGYIVALSDSTTPSASLPSYTGDGSSGVYVYGGQFEAGETPSSLVPTGSGSDVTRSAETFTIPSANLPWPEPNYIGSELVTNGTFDTDVSGWSSTDTEVELTHVTDSLRAYHNDANTLYRNFDGAYSSNILTGALIEVKIKLKTITTFPSSALRFYQDGGSLVSIANTTDEQKFYVLNYAAGLLRFRIRGTTDVEIDTVSVREIDPLSVSIAMDGRVTYADEDTYSTSIFYRWFGDANNYLVHRIDTALTQTGHQVAQQRVDGVDDYSTGNPSNTMFSPDVLVPFNIAVRHGTTFVQVASDGLTPAANTTPTALPDLSATDLRLAYDYMGTISVFRVWDRDIGDTGLVEATNPSLEPSLSLTFEGTGTNSFVVNNWSE